MDPEIYSCPCFGQEQLRPTAARRVALDVAAACLRPLSRGPKRNRAVVTRWAGTGDVRMCGLAHVWKRADRLPTPNLSLFV
jgi:hypothetical protein